MIGLANANGYKPKTFVIKLLNNPYFGAGDHIGATISRNNGNIGSDWVQITKCSIDPLILYFKYDTN